MSHSDSVLQSQFRDLPQQHAASSLGMWVFLSTEVMFFGGMFLTYAINRATYPAAFAAASHELNVPLGTINTAVLICSSLTMALAVRSAQTGKRRSIIGYLIATMALGLVFLGIKSAEYAEKFSHHLVPGYHFIFPGPFTEPAKLYFSLYFAMTGMHALHMIIGEGVLIFLLIEACKQRYTPEYSTPVEMSGLYWHFVDIIWIYLYPLFYLIDIHK